VADADFRGRCGDLRRAEAKTRRDALPFLPDTAIGQAKMAQLWDGVHNIERAGNTM
jgi:hypothetical protein